MSPEAYNDSIYSEKSDVWALGVVFHEMLTGTIPVMRTTDVDEYFRYLTKMKTA
jgi:serine/threonine protein kinase